MEFRDLASIVNCLKKWDQIRSNATDVVQYLGTGNHFQLQRDKPTASNLHAYPGIGTEDDALYFFILSANADKVGSEIDLFNAITVCKLESSPGNGHEISDVVARKRIANWDKDFSKWAIDQIDKQQQTQGIFKAFNIPSDYAVQNTKYSVFLGLKEDSRSVTGYDADLITCDTSKSSIVFYDTVRPVPPFDVTIPQSSFYLLSLVQKQ
ncbi:MAG TPA: hypothetical protein VF676_07055 [Flavobacterium sp.]|jgi:hypothetical protein